MKKYLPAAILIAATLAAFLSCNWFRSNKKTAFDLTGQWNVDSSYYLGKIDSGSIELMPPALRTLNNERLMYTFNADSTIRITSAKDTATSKYYFQDSSVFIKEDSVFTAFRLGVINDSLITLTTKDSVQFRLTRQ